MEGGGLDIHLQPVCQQHAVLTTPGQSLGLGFTCTSNPAQRAAGNPLLPQRTRPAAAQANFIWIPDLRLLSLSSVLACPLLPHAAADRHADPCRTHSNISCCLVSRSETRLCPALPIVKRHVQCHLHVVGCPAGAAHATTSDTHPDELLLLLQLLREPCTLPAKSVCGAAVSSRQPLPLDILLLLGNDLHGHQHIQCIIDAPPNVFLVVLGAPQGACRVARVSAGAAAAAADAAC